MKAQPKKLSRHRRYVDDTGLVHIADRGWLNANFAMCETGGGSGANTDWRNGELRPASATSTPTCLWCAAGIRR